MNGKKTILAALLVCFAGVALYNIVLFGTEKKPDPPTAGRMEQGLPRLKLDFSSFEKPPYPGVKRDIFNGPGQVQKAAFEKVQPIQLPVPPVSAPSLPEPKLPSALQAFASEAKFMGFVDNSSNRTAFIVRGQDVYALKKGGYAGKFRVEDISNGNIILKDDETSEKASILY